MQGGHAPLEPGEEGQGSAHLFEQFQLPLEQMPQHGVCGSPADGHRMCRVCRVQPGLRPRCLPLDLHRLSHRLSWFPGGWREAGARALTQSHKIRRKRKQRGEPAAASYTCLQLSSFQSAFTPVTSFSLERTGTVVSILGTRKWSSERSRDPTGMASGQNWDQSTADFWLVPLLLLVSSPLEDLSELSTPPCAPLSALTVGSWTHLSVTSR